MLDSISAASSSSSSCTTASTVESPTSSQQLNALPSTLSTPAPSVDCYRHSTRQHSTVNPGSPAVDSDNGSVGGIAGSNADSAPSSAAAVAHEETEKERTTLFIGNISTRVPTDTMKNIFAKQPGFVHFQPRIELSQRPMPCIFCGQRLWANAQTIYVAFVDFSSHEHAHRALMRTNNRRFANASIRVEFAMQKMRNHPNDKDASGIQHARLHRCPAKANMNGLSLLQHAAYGGYAHMQHQQLANSWQQHSHSHSSLLFSLPPSFLVHSAIAQQSAQQQLQAQFPNPRLLSAQQHQQHQQQSADSWFPQASPLSLPPPMIPPFPPASLSQLFNFPEMTNALLSSNSAGRDFGSGNTFPNQMVFPDSAAIHPRLPFNFHSPQHNSLAGLPNAFASSPSHNFPASTSF